MMKHWTELMTKGMIAAVCHAYIIIRQADSAHKQQLAGAMCFSYWHESDDHYVLLETPTRTTLVQNCYAYESCRRSRALLCPQQLLLPSDYMCSVRIHVLKYIKQQRSQTCTR